MRGSSAARAGVATRRTTRRESGTRRGRVGTDTSVVGAGRS
jgi:hypothetical protein